MAIGEETNNGGISGFGLEDDAAESIRIVNRTTADDPIGTSSHVQADLDNFDSGNPLLAESAVVTIDAPIGKLRRIHKMENAVASQTDSSTMCRKGDFDDENHANEPANTIVEPPDGGLRAWMIMIGSFTINGVLFSIINSYSLIYQELQKRLIEAGETEVSSKAGTKLFHNINFKRDNIDTLILFLNFVRNNYHKYVYRFLFYRYSFDILLFS